MSSRKDGEFSTRMIESLFYRTRLCTDLLTILVSIVKCWVPPCPLRAPVELSVEISALKLAGEHYIMHINQT